MYRCTDCLLMTLLWSSSTFLRISSSEVLYNGISSRSRWVFKRASQRFMFNQQSIMPSRAHASLASIHCASRVRPTFTLISLFIICRAMKQVSVGSRVRKKIGLQSMRTSRHSHTARLRLTYSSLNNTRQHGGDRHLDPLQLPLRRHHSHGSPTPRVRQRMPMHDL